MGNGDNSIKGNILEVAPEWADDVRRSMDWIDQWYAKRKNYKQEEGLGLVSLADMYNVKSKLAHAWVCANQGGAECIKQALQRGDLSLWAPEVILADYGLTPDGQVFDDTLFHKKFVLQDLTAGRFFPIFNVPVVMINTDLIHQKQAEGIPVYIEDTLIHELTHGLERFVDERAIDKIIDQVDYYLNSGTEVYARLNVVRAHFQLDPTKAVTLNDVKAMRQQLEEQRKAYLDKRVELDPKKSFKEGKLDAAVFDRLPKILVVEKILSRYSDDELLMLFNETAMRRELDDLDQEHALALNHNADKSRDIKGGLGVSRKDNLSQVNRPVHSGTTRHC